MLHFWLEVISAGQFRLVLLSVGILSRMLCVKVTLTDIAKWFPKPAFQKMHIHSQLVELLSNADLSWPPNADCFGQCSCFKPLHCSGKQQDTMLLVCAAGSLRNLPFRRTDIQCACRQADQEQPGICFCIIR